MNITNSPPPPPALASPGNVKILANALNAPPTPQRRLEKFDPSSIDPELRKAAQGMESMFVDYMMKVMRQTVPKNDMDLESPATEVYRSMLDSEYAQKAAKAGGIGLADQIIAYLQTTRYPKGVGAIGAAGDKSGQEPKHQPSSRTLAGGQAYGKQVQGGKP